MADTWFIRSGFNSPPTVAFNEAFMADQEGRMAMALIERWGMIAGKTDGQDETGRAKLELLSPEEVVDRAFETAHLAFKALHDRGLMIPVPTFEEIEDRAKDQEDRRKN
jgi:hypothetical protein